MPKEVAAPLLTDALMQPRIFISHSAKEEETDAMLMALERKLTEDGFDVLVDRTRLQLGIDWRANLNEWLASCHGAVLLVSQAALNSDWVRNEATILGHRYDRSIAEHYDFPFLIIFMGGTGPHSIDQPKFGLTQLERINAVTCNPGRSLLDQDFTLFAKLRDTPETEEDELFSDLSEKLREADERRLIRVGERLDPNISRWAPQTRRRHPADTLATLLVAMSLEDAAKQLRRIWRTEDRQPKDIIYTLEPNWSDPRSVDWLIDDFVKKEAPRVGLVKATDLTSIWCHIERARRRDLSKDWYEVEIPKVDDDLDAMIDTLSADLGARMGNKESREQIRKGISDWAKKGNPCLFVFRSRNDYDALGKAVQETFGPVHCLVLDNIGAGADSLSVMPYINPDREKAYLDDRTQAYMVLNSRRGGRIADE